MAIRKKYSKAPGTKKAYGIGDDFDPRSVDSLNTAYERFITAAESNPDQAGAAMVTLKTSPK